MDAGPVLAQRAFDLDPDMQSPEALNFLFARGAEMLLDRLSLVWACQAAELAMPQAQAVLVLARRDMMKHIILDICSCRTSRQSRTLQSWPRRRACWTSGNQPLPSITKCPLTLALSILCRETHMYKIKYTKA